jgi:superfamily II DNA helicase RecQ
LSPKKKAKSSDNESPQNTSSEQYEGCLSRGSVIVYVWRQKDAEVVAENIIASGVEGGVVVYHGGMEAGARSKSQSRVSDPRIIARFFMFGFTSD